MLVGNKARLFTLRCSALGRGLGDCFMQVMRPLGIGRTLSFLWKSTVEVSENNIFDTRREVGHHTRLVEEGLLKRLWAHLCLVQKV